MNNSSAATQRSRGYLVGPDGRFCAWNALCGEEISKLDQRGNPARVEVIVPERFTERVRELLSQERILYGSPNADSVSIKDYCEIGQFHRAGARLQQPDSVNLNAWRTSKIKY